MGRSAHGVKGITLSGDDTVVGVCVVDEEKSMLTVTENGMGKRTEFSEFKIQHRGGRGVHCHNVTEKTGLIAGAKAVTEKQRR